MSDDRKSWVRTVVLSVLIGFLGGVGVMAMTVNGDVKLHTVLIDRAARDFQDEKTRTDFRVRELAEMFRESNNLVRSTIEHTSKLIATIEIQNRLILDQNKTIQDLRNQ